MKAEFFDALANMRVSLENMFSEVYGPGKLVFVPDVSNVQTVPDLLSIRMTNEALSPKETFKHLIITLGTTEEALKSKERSRELVDLRRMIAIIMLNEFPTRMSLKTVGKLFGRDHTTVIHYKEVHDDLMCTEEEYRSRFRMLDMELQRFKQININHEQHV